ncbi:SGNH/GDSL hydrolase family protein [Aquirufa ecclesiirivi]|uniref:SGNH/GDSL hydrolase family protein n=1 Tax=Aquirufa ecclesiirivi TaxID=2715124 RepID=UPI00140DFA6D|nr:SGNH/GDSL hydrolase family protein [Aquirufa ecclesiirivi]NHC47882.1 SGNH/GDSL hydrolase family protein [Aquirufa ecclesiirivi]
MKITRWTGLMVCFLGFSIQAMGQASSSQYLPEIKQELLKEWPKNRSINLVFHGHSVPAGYFKTPVVNTLGAYPFQVLKSLKEQYPLAVINVINTSVGGENAEKGAERFEQEVLTHRPDLIFIDYVLNDRGLGLERAKVAWEKMIQMAQSKGIKVILLSASPDQRVDILDTKSVLDQHGQQVQELARIHQVGFVDSYELFRTQVKAGTPISEWMSQVNHPNEKGHALIATEIMRYFK